jgi:hypothetical protein
MENTLNNIQPYLSCIKDLVTIVSLLIAGYVAFKGLHTWRSQLKGTVEYELAKRLLKATYQLRNELQNTRNPLIMAGETEAALKEAKLDIKSTEKDFQATSMAAVYKIRWKYVVDAYKAFELEVLEAEVIWGPEAKRITSIISKNILELSSALNLYLSDIQSEGKYLDYHGKENIMKIVFSMALTPGEDIYLNDLFIAIKSIEDFVKPHLKK